MKELRVISFVLGLIAGIVSILRGFYGLYLIIDPEMSKEMDILNVTFEMIFYGIMSIILLAIAIYITALESREMNQ